MLWELCFEIYHFLMKSNRKFLLESLLQILVKLIHEAGFQFFYFQNYGSNVEIKPDSSSVQLSLSVVSDSLQTHGLQHARLLCPSPIPGPYSTHIYWVSDAIQSCHPLSYPSPPAFNISKDQGLFKWVSSSHQVAKGLEFQLQHQSFQWTLRTDLL